MYDVVCLITFPLLIRELQSHAQAGDIATKLEGGMKVLTTTVRTCLIYHFIDWYQWCEIQQGFKSLLKLAIVSAKPLREGMRIYATQVTPVQSEDWSLTSWNDWNLVCTCTCSGIYVSEVPLAFWNFVEVAHLTMSVVQWQIIWKWYSLVNRFW